MAKRRGGPPPTGASHSRNRKKLETAQPRHMKRKKIKTSVVAQNGKDASANSNLPVPSITSLPAVRSAPVTRSASASIRLALASASNRLAPATRSASASVRLAPDTRLASASIRVPATLVASSGIPASAIRRVATPRLRPNADSASKMASASCNTQGASAGVPAVPVSPAASVGASSSAGSVPVAVANRDELAIIQATRELAQLIRTTPDPRVRDLYLILELRLGRLTQGDWSEKKLVESLTKFEFNQWVADLKLISGTYKRKGVPDCTKYAYQVFAKLHRIAVKKNVFEAIKPFVQEKKLVTNFVLKFKVPLKLRQCRVMVTPSIIPAHQQLKNGKKSNLPTILGQRRQLTKRTAPQPLPLLPLQVRNREATDKEANPVPLTVTPPPAPFHITLTRCDRLLRNQSRNTAAALSCTLPFASKKSSGNRRKRILTRSTSSTAPTSPPLPNNPNHMSQPNLRSPGSPKPRSHRTANPPSPSSQRPLSPPSPQPTSLRSPTPSSPPSPRPPSPPSPKPINRRSPTPPSPGSQGPPPNARSSTTPSQRSAPSGPSKKSAGKGRKRPSIPTPSKWRKSARPKKKKQPYTPSEYDALPHPTTAVIHKYLHLLPSSSEDDNESLLSVRSSSPAQVTRGRIITRAPTPQLLNPGGGTEEVISLSGKSEKVSSDPGPSEPDDSNGSGGDDISSTSSEESMNEVVNSEGLAKCLGLSDKELSFVPPSEFESVITAEVLNDIFDFNTGLFKPFIYQKPLDNAMRDHLVTCAFQARSSPEYPKFMFCKLRGRCKCGIVIIVKLPFKPKKGRDSKILVEVKNLENYKLFQDKPTNRQCRNVERKELGKELQTVKSVKVLLDKASVNDKLRYVHNNNEEYTLDTLKRVKSDYKYIDRTSMDPVEDLRNRAERFHKDHNPNRRISGFIHNIVAEKDFTVYFYDHTSLELHYQMMKQGVIIYLDATGNLVGNYNNKQVLTYLLVGKAPNGTHYLIAEMVTSNLTQQSPRNFLQHLRDQIIHSGKSNRDKVPFCRVAVCDFSFSLIQGYVSALCETDMHSYCKFSWDVFNGKIGKCKRIVIYICAAHLIRAFARNLKSKLPKGKSYIVNIACFAIARLAECLSLPEFQRICSLIIETFLSEYLPEERVKENIAELKCREASFLTAVAEESSPSPDPTFDVSDFTRGSLKSNSEFYKEFCRLKGKHKNIGKERNPYYCPEVVDVLENTYIAYFMFWSRFMVTKTKDDKFLRTTTAAVESQFNLKRTHLHPTRRDAIFNYAEIAFRYFKGYNRIRMKEIFRKRKPKPKLAIKNKGSTPIKKKLEKWRSHVPRSQSQTPKRRVSTYFSKQPGTPPTGKPKKNQGGALSVKRKRLLKPWPKLSMEKFQYIIKYDGINIYRCQVEELFDELRYLNDLVVDAYMNFLISTTNSENQFLATCSLMIGMYRNGDEWQSLEVPALEFIPDEIEFLHPLCRYSHWILLRISFQSGLCTVYDSLNTQDIEMESDIRNKVLPHFEKQKRQTRSWRIEYADVPFQPELWECGVHVLRNAEVIMTGRDPHADLDDYDKLYEILRKLLVTTDVGKKIVEACKSLQDIEDFFVANPAPRRSQRQKEKRRRTKQASVV